MSYPSRHCEVCDELVVFATPEPYAWEPAEDGSYAFEPGYVSLRVVELTHDEILAVLAVDEYATFYRPHRCARVRGQASLFEEVA